MCVHDPLQYYNCVSHAIENKLYCNNDKQSQKQNLDIFNTSVLEECAAGSCRVGKEVERKEGQWSIL